MTRLRCILIAVIVTGLVASAVNAAGIGDPKSLLLRSSDVPGGAKRISFGGTKGTIKIPRTVNGKAAYVAYKFTNGSRHETLGNAVGTLGSSSDAHDVFASLKRKASKDVTFPTISLKRFGDEQFAKGISKHAFSLGLLMVRSGSVIWEIVVGDFPGFSKARLIGEMQKYAAKAKAHVT